MGIRSFLAFSLPAPIREVAEPVLRDLSGASRDVKWVRPQNVHITLVFLGSVDEAVIPGVTSAAAGICTTFSPFRLSVNGVGFFPNPRRPRVIWLGLQGDVERMGRFRDALQKALEPFGVEPEKRPFQPHLTLGRFRKGGVMDDRLARAMERHARVTSPECTFSEFVLFRSDLHPSGAVYTALARFPLSGP